MEIIPVERFSIRTPQSPEAVIQRLSDVIERETIAQSYQDYDQFYQGKIQGREFEIHAIRRNRSLFLPMTWRSSYSPVIKGEIQPELNETLINVTMAPHIAVTAVTILWLGLVSSCFCMMLFSWIFSIGTFYESPIVVLCLLAGMVIFVYVFSVNFFKSEMQRSRLFLEGLFEVD